MSWGTYLIGHFKTANGMVFTETKKGVYLIMSQRQRKFLSVHVSINLKPKI
jgi:hypothetical protein